MPARAIRFDYETYDPTAPGHWYGAQNAHARLAKIEAAIGHIHPPFARACMPQDYYNYLSREAKRLKQESERIKREHEARTALDERGLLARAIIVSANSSIDTT